MLNRIPPPSDNGVSWRPGLPPAGTICDVRPTVMPSDVWRNLLVLGYVEDDELARAVVRVPRQAGPGTFAMTFRPIRTEWRPIVVPEGLEVHCV